MTSAFKTPNPEAVTNPKRITVAPSDEGPDFSQLENVRRSLELAANFTRRFLGGGVIDLDNDEPPVVIENQAEHDHDLDHRGLAIVGRVHDRVNATGQELVDVVDLPPLEIEPPDRLDGLEDPRLSQDRIQVSPPTRPSKHR